MLYLLGFVILIGRGVQTGLGSKKRVAVFNIPGFWRIVHGANGKVLLTFAVGNIPLGMWVFVDLTLMYKRV
jgi:hypothetical protein